MNQIIPLNYFNVRTKCKNIVHIVDKKKLSCNLKMLNLFYKTFRLRGLEFHKQKCSSQKNPKF